MTELHMTVALLTAILFPLAVWVAFKHDAEMKKRDKEADNLLESLQFRVENLEQRKQQKRRA